MLEELQKLKDETGADITEDIQAVFDSGFSFYQGVLPSPPSKFD